jgi:hypothetical protein
MRVPKHPAEGVKFSRFAGDGQFPENFNFSLVPNKTKEDSKNGNASAKKHYRPVWDGSNAREDLSSDFR